MEDTRNPLIPKADHNAYNNTRLQEVLSEFIRDPENAELPGTSYYEDDLGVWHLTNGWPIIHTVSSYPEISGIGDAVVSIRARHPFRVIFGGSVTAQHFSSLNGETDAHGNPIHEAFLFPESGGCPIKTSAFRCVCIDIDFIGEVENARNEPIWTSGVIITGEPRDDLFLNCDEIVQQLGNEYFRWRSLWGAEQVYFQN